MRTLVSSVALAAALVLPAAACTAAGGGSAPASAQAALSDAEIATIQQLCQTVSLQYALYLDAKDWEHLPSVFAEDGVWEVLCNKMEGRAAIRDYWKRRTADWTPTHGRLHQISNQVIDVIDRDHARGTSKVVIYFFDTSPDAKQKLVPTLIAQNHDEFIRTAEGWKLQHRSVERIANGIAG